MPSWPRPAARRTPSAPSATSCSSRLRRSKARSQERANAAVNGPGTAEARQLARERLINAELEATVEALRLKIAEAKLAREAKLADVRDAQPADRRRPPPGLSEDARSDAAPLSRAGRRAGTQPQAGGGHSGETRPSGPTIRWSATSPAGSPISSSSRPGSSRTSRRWRPGPRPALEEQRALADRAQADFAEIKQLLDDGNVSRLDALRLNNDFRRIGPERDRLLRNELATDRSAVAISMRMP